MGNEKHADDKLLWLRAAVMGANDGILSTSSLMIGVAAVSTNQHALITTAFSALIAGALSMACGEYVSVSSEKDTELSNIEKEKYELEHQWDNELEELTNIYVNRGLPLDLATDVAQCLMDHDPLEAHTRDELGIIPENKSNPIAAAISSAISFSLGSSLILLVSIFSSMESFKTNIVISTILSLIFLGFMSAYLGGTDIKKSIIRILIFGIFSMILTEILPYIL